MSSGTLRHITTADIDDRLHWQRVVDAMIDGHRQPRAELGDQFLGRGNDTLLSRSAWIDGLGIAVKSVSVLPGNAAHGLPTVQGALLLFDDANGSPVALIDSDVVTYWKTAADSALCATLLARQDSEHLVILGAGTVAHSLVLAYQALFPSLTTVTLWNRSRERAETLATTLKDEAVDVVVATEAAAAVSAADIVCTATLSHTPVLHGEWLSPGTHVDLIGAFTGQMREADDAVWQRGRLFVDARATTIDHIGELLIPIAAGVFTADDIQADLYDLVAGQPGRRQPDDITVCKNGGGAHLDLMTARAIVASLADHTP